MWGASSQTADLKDQQSQLRAELWVATESSLRKTVKIN